MRHVADGLLNAWLDGELNDAGEIAVLEGHLANCASCRARLEAERQVRQRAGELLSVSSAAPLAGAPFSELVARARAGAEPRTGPVGGGRGGRWWVPASWAASVLLALALGWNARDLLEGRDTAAGNGQAAPRRAVAVADEVATAAAGESGDDRPGAGVQAPSPSAGAAPPVPLAPAPVQAAASSPEGVVVAGAAARQAEAVARSRPAEAVAEVTFQAVPAEAVAPTWAQLAERIGVPVYRLEGMQALSVEVAGDSTVLRSVYALPAGGRVELLQEIPRRPGLAPSLPAEARMEAAAAMDAGKAAGAHVLRVERDGVRLTLAGELSPDELARLAERLRSD
jgi:hypothetical protein